MALSSNILEYEDCREFFDRALASPRGIRLTLPARGEAIHLRQRLYKFRQLEKLRYKEIYPVGDNQRNSTPYDTLRVAIDDCLIDIFQVEPIQVMDL